jgi:hypothetical protein
MSETTTYTTDAGDFVIEFDYTPAEKQTYTDPGCSEYVDVLSIMAGPFDILEWISPESLAFFEEKCMHAVADGFSQAAYDRGADRYEERMAA